ncbi:QueT transporter family protein [Solibacillus silvestris]|uniref:QueT transporter family protein n=1 Tax=Solibacillus silvestris TaxID=76853 RepID=UPI003F822253
MENSVSSTRINVHETAKVAIVASLYVAVTLVLAVISFGAVQLRLSEMFNYLVLFHKRYIVAVTLGVVIANFFSPMWWMDVPVGGIATLIVLIICRIATKNMKNLVWKMVVTGVIVTASMFTVAAQLMIVFDLPFWPTYGMVAVGEAFSMLVGGVTMYLLQKKIDFTK